MERPILGTSSQSVSRKEQCCAVSFMCVYENLEEYIDRGIVSDPVKTKRSIDVLRSSELKERDD